MVHVGYGFAMCVRERERERRERERINVFGGEMMAPVFLNAVVVGGANPSLLWRRYCFRAPPFSPPLLRLFLPFSTRRSTWLSAPPCALFGGLFGRQDNSRPTNTQNSDCYHLDVPLSFPESILDNTFLAGRELKCCYKASIDGFSATIFHEKCDFKGPCVIVGETDKGVRFGAFNPEGYRSTDDYYDSLEPFLFYWEADGRAPAVLRKVGGSGAALFDYARGGPQFGADGLLIGPPLAPVMGGFSGPDTNSGVGVLTQGKSRLGLSYAKRLDGKDSIFGNDRYATICEVEVFCSPAIAKLY